MRFLSIRNNKFLAARDDVGTFQRANFFWHWQSHFLAVEDSKMRKYFVYELKICLIFEFHRYSTRNWLPEGTRSSKDLKFKHDFNMKLLLCSHYLNTLVTSFFICYSNLSSCFLINRIFDFGVLTLEMFWSIFGDWIK